MGRFGIVGLVIVALAVGAVGGGLATKKTKATAAAVPSLQDRISRLTLERMCAEQADKAFKMAGFEPKPNVINSFYSHYSMKLGHCFAVFHTYDASAIVGRNTVSNFESIQEPFEGDDYGGYFQSHDMSGPIPQDRYVDCHVEPPGGRRENCKSEEGWNVLRARYMRD